MAQDFRFPSIDGLRAFEAAARLGSFERAAEELDVGASAVAKRVATLEALLGTVLLQRGARALTLTADGRDYVAQVRQALALLAAMPLHRRAAQRRQRLRVVAPPTFARQILMPALDGFAQEQPQVDVELQLSLPLAEGSLPTADVEVRYGSVSGDAAELLLQENVLPLAAPALLARLRLRRVADLAGAPLLRTPLQPWADWLRAAGIHLPEPSSGPKLMDLGLALEAAVAGQGVALARPSLALPWLRAHALQPAWPLQVAPAMHYQLARVADGAAAAQFADWLRRRCQQAVRAGAEELSRLG